MSDIQWRDYGKTHMKPTISRREHDRKWNRCVRRKIKQIYRDRGGLGIAKISGMITTQTACHRARSSREANRARGRRKYDHLLKEAEERPVERETEASSFPTVGTPSITTCDTTWMRNGKSELAQWMKVGSDYIYVQQK